MRKWFILVLVLLGGLLLALRYFVNQRGRDVVSSPASSQMSPEGVPLPAHQDVYVPPMDGAAGRSSGNAPFSGLAFPMVQSGYTGACEGGSLESIRSTHGTYWGYSAKGAAFLPTENGEMYDLAASYVGCVAVAYRDPTLCDGLPAEPPEGDKGLTVNDMPRYKCRERSINTLFDAYMAGKKEFAGYCQDAAAFWRPGNAAKISVPEFCKAAAGGMGSAADFIGNNIPSLKDAVRRGMPDSRSSCDGDAKCITRFEMYSAFKDSVLGKCPRAAEGYCEAMITRGPAACERTAREMSTKYCAAVARVKKAYGGYIGVSLEAIKAAKAAEERQRKDNEKLQAEMNKRAKKMLRREE